MRRTLTISIAVVYAAVIAMCIAVTPVHVTHDEHTAMVYRDAYINNYMNDVCVATQSVFEDGSCMGIASPMGRGV